jgi:hypothetical protein
MFILLTVVILLFTGGKPGGIVFLEGLFQSSHLMCVLYKIFHVIIIVWHSTKCQWNMENHNFEIRAVNIKYIIYFFTINILVSPSLEVQVM